jgi:hypothetical protein
MRRPPKPGARRRIAAPGADAIDAANASMAALRVPPRQGRALLRILAWSARPGRAARLLPPAWVVVASQVLCAAASSPGGRAGPGRAQGRLAARARAMQLLTPHPPVHCLLAAAAASRQGRHAARARVRATALPSCACHVAAQARPPSEAACAPARAAARRAACASSSGRSGPASTQAHAATSMPLATTAIVGPATAPPCAYARTHAQPGPPASEAGASRRSRRFPQSMVRQLQRLHHHLRRGGIEV